MSNNDEEKPKKEKIIYRHKTTPCLTYRCNNNVRYNSEKLYCNNCKRKTRCYNCNKLVPKYMLEPFLDTPICLDCYHKDYY